MRPDNRGLTIEATMRHVHTRIIAGFFLCFFAGLQAQTVPEKRTAPVPRLIRFSGNSQFTGGSPPSGPVGARFAIYSVDAGGTPLWSETQNVTLDASGRYSTVLGSTTNEGVPAEI